MKSFPLLSHISIVSTLIGLTYDLKGLFKLQFKSFSPLFKSHSLEYYVLSYYRRLWRGFAKAKVINVDLSDGNDIPSWLLIIPYYIKRRDLYFMHIKNNFHTFGRQWRPSGSIKIKPCEIETDPNFYGNRLFISILSSFFTLRQIKNFIPDFMSSKPDFMKLRKIKWV